MTEKKGFTPEERANYLMKTKDEVIAELCAVDPELQKRYKDIMKKRDNKEINLNPEDPSEQIHLLKDMKTFWLNLANSHIYRDYKKEKKEFDNLIEIQKIGEVNNQQAV